MNIYKKCKFGCVFSVDDKVWAAATFKAMKYPNQTFKCLTCHRDNPISSYTTATGGAATAVATSFHAPSVGAGGKKVDDTIKQRMLAILPGLGASDAAKTQRVNAIYQRLSMLLMNAELTSNFPTPRIFNILQSGAMKNMWHFAVGTSAKDQAYAAERDSGERKFFGGMSATMSTTVVPDAEERPIYLVLNVGNLMQGGAAGYGHSVIVYKDAVKMRSTFLATDSLQMIRGDKANAVGMGDVATFGSINNVLLRVTDAKLAFLCSLAGGPAHKYVDEFIEAHGWGELTLRQDVKAILMSQPDLDDFLRLRDSDHKDLFPPELHGKSTPERIVLIENMKTDLKNLCAQNGIELHFLNLAINTRTNVAPRPVSKA